MLVETNKKEIKFLKSLGFKKEWFTDKSAFWFLKTQKTNLLGKCEIAVQDFNNKAIIVVDTLDKATTSDGTYFTLIETKYSRKNLIKILGFLS